MIAADNGVILDIDGEQVSYKGQVLGCNACEQALSPSALQ
jgi:hypothetical protein